MGEEDLRQFLKAWLEWAESGGKSRGQFYNTDGICNANYRWMVANAFSPERRHRAYETLKRALPGCDDYPFGGKSVYWVESCDGTMHLNQERLNWVRRQLCQTS